MPKYATDLEMSDVISVLRRIEESCADLYSIVDFTDATTFNKEDGIESPSSIINPAMGYANALQRPSATACAYMNEQQLRMLRARSRAFCCLNPYWKAVRENKISYSIGTGHVWSVVPRHKGQKVSDDIKWKVQEELEQFIKINKYRRRQGEKLTRLDRDGEFFLRYVDTKADGVLRVRFIEPILIKDPPGMGPTQNVWFGVQFDGEDYEEPLGYYICPTNYEGTMTSEMDARWREMVDVSEIQHHTVNVDLGSPRGLPTTYDLQDALVQAVSTRKSMGKLVDIRARIALIRKQVNATIGQIQPLLNRNRSGQSQTAGGAMRNAFQIPYGGIIDTNDQRAYEFPAQNIETDKIVHSLKADLQSVAAAMGLADFTISADGTSAFANSLIKEGPMDRAIGRVQQDLIDDDTEVYERVLTHAAEKGRLPATILKDVRIDIMPPGVIARDRLVNTQADQILWQCGAISSDTMAAKANLDPNDEKEKGAEPRVNNGDSNPSQPGKAKSTARGVPAGQEPGPKANNHTEELEEGSHDPRSKEPVSKAELAMASILLTDDWLSKTKQEIAGLPNNGTCPRDAGIRSEYAPGIQGVFMGMIDGQSVWAVDADAVMVAYSSHDFVCAGNHERWSWIPENVILVDWSYSTVDMSHCIYHETIETRLMSVGKWSYAMAHRMSNKYEMDYLLAIRPELAALKPQE